MNCFERWTLGNGENSEVTSARRSICGEDVCPECGRTILVAVAIVRQGGRVFRLECLFCGWTTDALPDPEPAPGTDCGAFKRCLVEAEAARRLLRTAMNTSANRSDTDSTPDIF